MKEVRTRYRTPSVSDGSGRISRSPETAATGVLQIGDKIVASAPTIRGHAATRCVLAQVAAKALTRRENGAYFAVVLLTQRLAEGLAQVRRRPPQILIASVAPEQGRGQRPLRAYSVASTAPISRDRM